MVIVAFAEPPGLVAVIVYTVEEDIAVGVPEIVPLDDSNTRPVGNDGDMDHVSTEPPLEVGVTSFIAVPIVNVKELGL